MNIFEKTKAKKVIASVVGVAVGFTMTVGSAGAQTVEDLQAQIADLLATIAGLQTQLAGMAGGTTPSGSCTAYTFTTDLDMKDTGADVLNLQKVLNTDADTQVAVSGVGSAGEETEYFGSLTKAAVIKFQDKYAAEVLTPIGIAAGTGYVGSMTRAKLNTLAVCDADDTDDDADDDADDADDGTPATGESMSVETLPLELSSVVNNGATGMPVLAMRLTGSVDTDVTVTSLVVRRMGAGLTSDISAVYVYDGDTRLTTGRTVNSSTHEATFTGLNITIPAGQSVDLTVMADLTAPGSYGTHQFAVMSADAIIGAEFAGSYPITGPGFAISGAGVGSVTISRTGSLTNPKVGEQDAKVAEFRVEAGSSEGVTLNKIVFYSVGSISTANISDLELKLTDGTVLATAAGIDGNNLVTLVFDTPYVLEKGGSKIMELFADVSGASRANDTIRFYIDNDADVAGTGMIYGYGVSVTRSDYDNVTGCGTDASCTTVAGGQITNVFGGPSTMDVTTNANDLELFRWTMSSQANVEVRSTAVTLTVTGENIYGASAANYTDIKIVDVTTGVVVAGPSDGSTAGLTQTFTFTDYYNLSAGQSRTFKVTADTANNALLNGDTVTVALGAFGASAIKNIDNNTFVATTDVVPSSVITGNTHNILTPSLTVAISSTPTSQTYIKGSSFESLGINLKAGTGGDVKINSLTIQTYVDTTSSGVFVSGADATTSATDNILQANLWDGATQVGTTKSPTASTGSGTGGVLSFTSLNYTVPAGTTKTLKLKANSPSTATAASRVKFAVSAISAQDSEGNTVGATNNATNGTTADSGVRITIANTGTLTAVKAADDTESETSIVVAGTSNVVLGKYRLTAQNEELKVTKAQIDLVATTSYSSIVSVGLYDGASLVSETVNMDSTGSVSFSSVNFIVPKDDSKTLTVKATLNSVSGGAVSGSNLQVELEEDNFEARGTDSSTVLVSANVTLDINGNSKILRKTNVTLTQNTSTGQLSSAITNGAEHGLYAFDVAVDSAENASLRQMKFQVTMTDNEGTNDTLTATNWKMFRGSTDITGSVDIVQSDDTSDLTGSGVFSEGDATSSVRVVVVFGELTGEESINKSTSNTYTLKATLNGFVSGIDNDSVIVELLNDSTAQNTTAKYIQDTDATADEILLTLTDNAGGATTSANIIWSDNAAIPHYSTVDDDATVTTLMSNDWINGYLLKNTPIGSRSINN